MGETRPSSVSYLYIPIVLSDGVTRVLFFIWNFVPSSPLVCKEFYSLFLSVKIHEVGLFLSFAFGDALFTIAQFGFWILLKDWLYVIRLRKVGMFPFFFL